MSKPFASDFTLGQGVQCKSGSKSFARQTRCTLCHVIDKLITNKDLKHETNVIHFK